MPAVSFDRLPDDARLWVFAAARPLDGEQQRALLARADAFLDRWAAHGAPQAGHETVKMLVQPDARTGARLRAAVLRLAHSARSAGPDSGRGARS